MNNDPHAEVVATAIKVLSEIGPEIRRSLEDLQRSIELQIVESKYKLQQLTTSESVAQEDDNESHEAPTEAEDLVSQEVRSKFADWPAAVRHVAKSESDKKLYALQILNEFSVNYNKKRILDFGCGACDITRELSFYTDDITSYDVIKWTDKFEIITDVAKLQESEPFDLIIVNDVLDHLVKDDPVQVLKTLHGILKEKGTIILNVHPWTARHGAHLYNQFNKAYIHLYLNSQELQDANLEHEHNLKVTKPLATYERWIKQAGLIVEDRRVINVEPESIFCGEIMDKIISNTWGKIDYDQALKIMSIQNIYYTLTK